MNQCSSSDGLHGTDGEINEEESAAAGCGRNLLLLSG